MVRMSSFIKNKEDVNYPFVLTILCLIILNIRLTRIEQWQTTKLQKVFRRSIRLLSYSIILYFTFLGMRETLGLLIYMLNL